MLVSPTTSPRSRSQSAPQLSNQNNQNHTPPRALFRSATFSGFRGVPDPIKILKETAEQIPKPLKRLETYCADGTNRGLPKVLQPSDFKLISPDDLLKINGDDSVQDTGNKTQIEQELLTLNSKIEVTKIEISTLNEERIAIQEKLLTETSTDSTIEDQGNLLTENNNKLATLFKQNSADKTRKNLLEKTLQQIAFVSSGKYERYFVYTNTGHMYVSNSENDYGTVSKQNNIICHGKAIYNKNLVCSTIEVNDDNFNGLVYMLNEEITVSPPFEFGITRINYRKINSENLTLTEMLASTKV